MPNEKEHASLKDHKHGTRAWTTWKSPARTNRSHKRGGVATLPLPREQAPRRERPAPPPPEKSVTLEYPRENESVGHPTYTLQIGAVPEAMTVEVAIDQSDWRPCRESMGLWWYDWSGYESGPHEAIARIQKDGGALVRSQVRRFTVRLPETKPS